MYAVLARLTCTSKKMSELPFMTVFQELSLLESYYER